MRAQKIARKHLCTCWAWPPASIFKDDLIATENVETKKHRPSFQANPPLTWNAWHHGSSSTQVQAWFPGVPNVIGWRNEDQKDLNLWQEEADCQVPLAMFSVICKQHVSLQHPHSVPQISSHFAISFPTTSYTQYTCNKRKHHVYNAFPRNSCYLNVK